ISSSGLVPCVRSARSAHVTGNSLKVPLATLTRPFPLVRSPSQTASARLTAAISSPPRNPYRRSPLQPIAGPIDHPVAKLDDIPVGVGDKDRPVAVVELDWSFHVQPRLLQRALTLRESTRFDIDREVDVGAAARAVDAHARSART